MTYKVKEKNIDLLTIKSKNYKYNFKSFFKSFFRFPMVYLFSKAYVPELYKFLQTYPRAGMIESKNGSVEVNTIAHYFEDAKKRGLVDLNFVYSQSELDSIKEVEILNDQNKKISALILKQPNSNKWVIGLHGWTENKYLALRQTYLYSQLGYNVLTFDAKGHGGSYGHFNDLGYSTPKDILSILKWLETQGQVDSYGVIGNSMGGASAIKFAEDYGYLDPKFKFTVDDAGFNDLLVELRYVLESNFKKPWWKIGYNLNKFLSKQLGINFKKYNLMTKINQISNVPILFIHGLDDDLVPVFNSEEFYQLKIKSEKNPQSEILTVEGVKHVQMISQANSIYVDTIKKFLTTIGEISSLEK